MMGSSFSNRSARAPRPVAARGRRALAVLLLPWFLQSCGYVARGAVVAYIDVNSKISNREIEIGLNDSFIRKYMNRVTIDAPFFVDKVSKVVNPAFIDGDLHMAVRSEEVGLPVVAEIVNAAREKEAVAFARQSAGTGVPVRFAGAWRIWPEHAGKAEEEQGEPVDELNVTDPDHVFEVHPVSRIGDIGLLDSFTPVKGFTPIGGRKAFEGFRKVPCTIRVEEGKTFLRTLKGLYNDAEFFMEIAGDRQVEVPGGRFVTASVRDEGGAVLAERVRMVFVDNTPPERLIRRLKKGDRLHVYGIPRIDLSEVWRWRQAPATAKEAPLPVEVIIIGVFEGGG